MNIPTRYIEEIGTQVWLRVYWDGACKDRTYHNAMRHIKNITGEFIESAPGGIERDYSESEWPTYCEDCGGPVEHAAEAEKQVFRKRLYNTTTGNPEIGDLYYTNWCGVINHRERCIYGWTNCNGKHLVCVLPTGHIWDIDGRASNCDKKKDTTHRCWVRHGTPPIVDVNKQGETCNAGAGSIDVPGWHGFLRNGHLIQC